MNINKLFRNNWEDSARPKTEADIIYERHSKILLKLDLFLLMVIVVTFVTYYQIISMFEIEQSIAVHVSISVGFVFAGLLFLSFRTHERKKGSEDNE